MNNGTKILRLDRTRTLMRGNPPITIGVALVALFISLCTHSQSHGEWPGKSELDQIGSTDSQTRDAGISHLLEDGPSRLQEIENARDELFNITRMRERIMTPTRDDRSLHAPDMEKTDEAIAFFLRHKGVAWVAEVLETRNVRSLLPVSEALLKMSNRDLLINRRLLLESCVNLLEDAGSFRSVGFEHPEFVMLDNVMRLTSKLTGANDPGAVEYASETLDQIAARAKGVAKTGTAWLQNHND